MNENMNQDTNNNMGMNQNNPVVKKKSNKGLIVLIILLLIIIILLLSYIVYDKLNDKESAKKNESEVKENANLDHKEGSDIYGFYYIPKYNAYYLEHGDTNHWGIDSCNSGKIDENGNYVVNCTLMDYSKESAGTNIKTTLKKVDDNFVFISNECESGECEKLKSNNNVGR